MPVPALDLAADADAAIVEAPALFDRIQAALADPATRALWLGHMIKTAIAVAVVIAVDRAVVRGLTRWGRSTLGLRLAARAVIVGIALAVLLPALGVDLLGWMSTDVGRRVSSSLFGLVVAPIGARVIWELAASAIDRTLSSVESSRLKTLLPLAHKILAVVLIALVGLIALSQLGVDIAPLLAGAGVVGVAVGFGSQKLVQDVITGTFILIENTIAIGDAVKLDAHAGTVESLSIRAIILRDVNGAVHTVPFSEVKTVINQSRDYGWAVFDILVGYRENTDRVGGVLAEIGADLASDAAFAPKLAGALEVLGVERFDPTGVVIKARIKTAPAQAPAVTREFNRRMKLRFDELSIEMPVAGAD